MYTTFATIGCRNQQDFQGQLADALPKSATYANGEDRWQAVTMDSYASAAPVCQVDHQLVGESISTDDPNSFTKTGDKEPQVNP